MKYLLVLSFLIVSCNELEPKTSLGNTSESYQQYMAQIEAKETQKRIEAANEANVSAEAVLSSYLESYKGNQGVVEIKVTSLESSKREKVTYYCEGDSHECSAEVLFENTNEDLKTAHANYLLVESMLLDLNSQTKDIVNFEKMHTRKDLKSMVEINLLKTELERLLEEFKSAIDL